MTSTSRRPHRKTRTGCKVCKSRKIKCDEQKPACDNCIRYDRDCEYAYLQGTPTSTGQGEPSINIISPEGTTPNDFNGFQLQHGFDDDPYTGQGLNLCHLELLHNFITTTSNTLHNHQTLRVLWRINTPQIGFKFDFVMDALLALSALHLARLKPDQHDFYTSEAKRLHQDGLGKASRALSQVDDDNCSALYVFAALTSFIALATPRDPEDILLVEENRVAEWITLFRGTLSIISLSQQQLHRGPFGPMFSLGHKRLLYREASTQKHPVDEHLEDLQRRIQEVSENGADLKVYIDTIEELRKAYLVVFAEGTEMFEPGDVFIWLFRMPEGYLNLLQRRTQESLAILAYYSVLLHQLEGFWYMTGWRTHLMNRVCFLLDEQHREWVQWPISEIQRLSEL